MSDTELRGKLIGLLKRHDWFYAYSDDHAVWQDGNAQRQEIYALLAQVPDGEALYNEYRPQGAP